MSEWGFITNHGLVLAVIAKHPRSTPREIGDAVGVKKGSHIRSSKTLMWKAKSTRPRLAEEAHVVYKQTCFSR
jgi:hypothetical protein